MARELLIAAGPGEWRAALVEDGVAAELYVERGDRAEAGSIHLGRVLRLVPALGAVLVDIGGERPAFLPQRDAAPRGQRLDEGERVVVQVRREAQAGKAARLTMATVLRGRQVELVAGRPGLAGAAALAAEEAARLSEAVEAPFTLTHPPLRAGSPLSRSAGEGADPRTSIRGRAGEGVAGLRILQPAPIEALVAEATGLREAWANILDRATHLDPPTRLGPTATFAAALANVLPAPPDRILVDEPAAIPEIRAAFPDAVVAHRPATEWPVDLDAVFDRALQPRVALEAGGSLHIEATRAAVLIDVDTGTPETGSPERAALAANLSAAAAIAREVRLRNLAGGIVIDFVGLDRPRLREQVRADLEKAIVADPARPRILGWTRLGHLELVRPRRGRPLAEALLEPAGSPVKTPATVAFEALRALRREARARPARGWRIDVAADVAASLAGPAAAGLRALEARLALAITIVGESGRPRERFEIVRM